MLCRMSTGKEKVIIQLEAWRATRRYMRQPISDEFRQAAAEMTERYSLSLVRRILKLDPWRLKKPSAKKLNRGADPELARSSLHDKIPMARFGEPDEVAAVVAFLASDDTSYVTGHALVVDVGQLTF
jgi:NAD(P)-dependent dehydrogenase (short-subunit alcohol dehydrogenase family)